MNHARKLLSVLLALVLAVSMLPAALAADGETHITILGTSDMHSDIWGFDYASVEERSEEHTSELQSQR